MRPIFYDAVVVGSGATGGAAAMALTHQGKKVLLLEAGEAIEPQSTSLKNPADEEDFKEIQAKKKIQASCFAFTPETHHFFVNDKDFPYTTTQGKPFIWIRNQCLGGKTNTWRRACLRMGDEDLKSESMGGLGLDWPIRYRDLQKHYNTLDRLFLIQKSRDQISFIPDGGYTKAPKIGPIGRHFKTRIEEKWLGHKVIALRMAGVLDPEKLKEVCPVCGERKSTCPSPPYTSSTATTIHSALSTGNLEIKTNSLVYKIEVDPISRQENSVQFVNTRTGKKNQIRTRYVILAASTLSTLRILLNSRSQSFPEGIGNSNGLLGKYFMDHSMGSLTCTIPKTNHKNDLTSLDEIDLYIPREPRATKGTRPKTLGYGIQISFWRDQRQAQSLVHLLYFAETRPSKKSYVTLHPSKQDKWGIPLLRINYEYGSAEKRVQKFAMNRLREIASLMDLEPIAEVPSAPPGLSIHELGGARMGTSARNSVIDPYNRCWDVPNILVVDGSAFVTSGTQNPTLTMMAIAMRACEHLK